MNQCVEEFIFTWTIENYSFCVSANGEEFYSPDFKANNICEYEWNVTLYPRGCEKSDDFVSLGLVYGYDNTGEKMTINFKIDFCNSKDEVFVSVEKKEIVLEKGREYLIPNFISIEELERKIQNSSKDSLIIRYRMFKQKNMTTEDPSIMSCTSKSEISFDVLSYLWNVLLSPTDEPRKKTFPIGDERQLCINLEVSDDDFCIEIKPLKMNSSLLRVKCQIVYLNNEGKGKLSKWDFFTFEKDTSAWIFPNFLKKSLLDKNDLENESLFLKFNFSVSNALLFGKFTENTICLSLLSEVTASSETSFLTLDFRERLFSKDFSDVSFRIDSEIISAHKFVLASRSPVFSAMFQHKMIESETGVVDVSDMDVQTLKLFLEFMYTGEVKTLGWEEALDLLFVAEKYQVPSLKNKCFRRLKNNLSTENVCDVVAVADKVGHQILKKDALEYITENSTEILGSPTWIMWVRENVELGSEILHSISNELKTFRNIN